MRNPFLNGDGEQESYNYRNRQVRDWVQKEDCRTVTGIYKLSYTLRTQIKSGRKSKIFILKESHFSILLGKPN